MPKFPIAIEQHALYVLAFVLPPQFHSHWSLAYANPDFSITVFRMDGACGAFWEKHEETYASIEGVPRFTILKIVDGSRGVQVEAVREIHNTPAYSSNTIFRSSPPSSPASSLGKRIFEPDWSCRRYLMHLLRGLQARGLITVTSFPQLDLEIARETLAGMGRFNYNKHFNYKAKSDYCS